MIREPAGDPSGLRKSHGVKQTQEEQTQRKSCDYLEAFQSVLRSTWKSFAYDHHETVLKIRQEAEYCASAFLLFSVFCLVSALSIRHLEAPHQQELEELKQEEDRDLREAILKSEVQAVEDLWLASSTMAEEEWKALAKERIRELNQDALVLLGCEDDDPPVAVDWGILNSFVYMLTVTTSIGYGHIYPTTSAGRAFTIVYALLGIPIFLILMADFGKLFTRLLKALFVFVRRVYRTATCRRFRKTKAMQQVKTPSPTNKGSISSSIPPLAVPESTSGEFEKQDLEQGHRRQTRQVRSSEVNEQTAADDSDLDEERPCCISACYKKMSGLCSRVCGAKAEEDTEEEPVIDDNFNLPVSLALLILSVYILVGCFIYPIWEHDWNMFTAFYFIFVSMTTIGFGDLVPKHPAYMMVTTIYLIFGLALTAMCINIIQEKLTDTFRKASEKLKESLGHIMATAMQGEDGHEGKEVEVAEVHGAKKLEDPSATETVSVKKET